MIINKSTNMFQIRSDMPNQNWLNDNNYVVIEDNTLLANKIIDNYPHINLIIENGIVVDVEIDITAKNAFEVQKQKKDKIEMLKQQLADTDYKAIKYAEGLLTEEEYVDIKAQRQAWRDEINELEGGLINE